MVIFTSDNGYNCVAHGFSDKVIRYEEGSKSPLLIYDPRLPMAVVTPEWKYIYWYYGGDGMMPTEELVHVGQDRYEMKNLAANLRQAEQLAAMRTMNDAQRDQPAHNSHRVAAAS